MKSMSKSELADLAGVSPRTFCRWLSLHREQLSGLGIAPNARLIPPVGVRYICEHYGIEVPEPANRRYRG